MILQADVEVVKTELKKTKTDKEYLDITLKQDDVDFPSHIFLFNKKKDELAKVFIEGAKLTLVYNWFFSVKNAKDVISLKDVVVCPKN